VLEYIHNELKLGKMSPKQQLDLLLRINTGWNAFPSLCPFWEREEGKMSNTEHGFY
jgi:hypothetical protein